MADSSDYDDLFQRAAAESKLPVNFIKAIAQQESGFNPKAVSPQGALGVMQMLPATARSMGAQDPFDPAQAIPAAARYLRQGYDTTGSLEGAAAYYHGGPDTRQWGPKTKAYVQSVGGILSKYNGSPATAGGSAPPDDNPFLAGVKPVDPWTDLTTAVQSRAGSADLGANAPTMSPDDVFKEITARAAANKTAPASTTPAQPTTTPEQTAAATMPPAAPGAPSAPAGDASAAVGGGIIGGIPIVGDALRGGLVRTAAAVRAYAPQALGGQPNTTYANELAKVQAWDQATQQQHPIATATGNVAGAAAAMAPAMAAAPAAFGIEGATLAGRSIASALTGGAIGGADAAARSGGSLTEAAKGAGLGAVFGGVAPGAGQLVGAGVQKAYNSGANLLLDRASGISTPARNMLMGAIDADTPQAIRANLDKLGPQGMIADAGPSTTGIAQGMALKPGAGKSELVQAIKDRATGTNARLAEDVAAIGPAEDPQTVTETILATRKAMDAQNYGAALSNAPDVDVKSVVQKIDGMLQTAEGKQKAALSNLRDQLVEKPAQPAVPGGPTGLLDARGNPIISAGKPATPEAYKSAAENLHNLKGEIDAVINYGAPGLGVEAGAVARQQGALKAVRGVLNEALQTQVPGYAEASAASAALAKRAEAVERGTQVLSGGKTTPTPGRDAAAYNAPELRFGGPQKHKHHQAAHGHAVAELVINAGHEPSAEIPNPRHRN
jgi:hypothetical protein